LKRCGKENIPVRHTVKHVVAPKVEVIIVVVAPFFFLTPEVEEDDFLFLFLWVALATASLCGNTIWDGLATTMLISMLHVAAFFNLFFGRPLHRKSWISELSY
jgi:hypothetical protein